MKKIFYDNEANRIKVLDDRFYVSKKFKDQYYPSVTTILEVYPKGIFFENWLKTEGQNSDQKKNDAGKRGTIVHEMIESFLKGNKISFARDYTQEEAYYTVDEWRMFERFVDFYSTNRPQIEAIEFVFASDELKYGGTIDCICTINGKRWLIDWKTSANVYPSYEFQLSAYAKAWNELNPNHKIDNTAILWLNAKTRGIDKTGKKIQGEGWQFVTFDRCYEESFKIFQFVHGIWNEENPNYKPKTLTMKTSYCIDEFQM